MKYVLLLLLCLPSSAQAELVLIDTRDAPSTNIAIEKIKYWAYDGKEWGCVSRWETLTTLPTTIFIHGNKTDKTQSIQTGYKIYQQLKKVFTDDFQFIIWSWPSDTILGPRKDAKLKISYCDTQAYYLATYLQLTGDETTLVGYSFGARIVAGAIQLVAGGEIAGRQLLIQDKRPRNLVLLAAAIDDQSFNPGHMYDLVRDCANLVVTCNRYDPVLKLYPKMFQPPGPPAMGLHGPRGRGGYLLDLKNVIRRSHALTNYLQVPILLQLFHGNWNRKTINSILEEISDE